MNNDSHIGTGDLQRALRGYAEKLPESTWYKSRRSAVIYKLTIRAPVFPLELGSDGKSYAGSRKKAPAPESSRSRASNGASLVQSPTANYCLRWLAREQRGRCFERVEISGVTVSDMKTEIENEVGGDGKLRLSSRKALRPTPAPSRRLLIRYKPALKLFLSSVPFFADLSDFWSLFRVAPGFPCDLLSDPGGGWVIFYLTFFFPFGRASLANLASRRTLSGTGIKKF